MSKKNSARPDFRTLFLELIVVFLGVTGGFVLNNYGENSDAENLELEYLNGFLKDVENNERTLTEAVKVDSAWLHRVKPLLVELKNGTLHPDSAQVAMELSIYVSQLEKYNGTYTGIINSGNLSLITNPELRDALVDYHINLEQITFTDGYFKEFFNSFIFPIVMSDFDILEGVPIDPDFYETLVFRNMVSSYYSTVHQRKDIYSNVLENTIEFKKVLQQELEQK